MRRESLNVKRSSQVVTGNRKKFIPYLLILPSFLFLISFSYYPAFSAFFHSFFKWDGFTNGEFVGFTNYLKIFSDEVMGTSAVNILKYILGRGFLNLIFPLLGAELIFHLRNKKASYFYRVLFIIPMVVPVMVILLLWKFIYNPTDGILNTILHSIGLGQFTHAWLGDFSTSLYSVVAIGFPWITGIGISGFALLIYLSGLQNIQPALFDAAKVDGIGPLTRFYYIELPLIVDQIKLILILTIINTLKSYVPIMVMTNGGPGNSSMVPGLYLYNTAFYYDRFGYACSIGIIMAIVLTILTYINNKYIKSREERTG